MKNINNELSVARENASTSKTNGKQKKRSETSFDVQIVGKKHRVVFVDGYNHEKLQGAQGRNYLDDQEMYVNIDQHSESVKDTVLHEILHSCERQVGLKPNEEFVHPIASVLFQVLRENKELTKLLFLQK